MAVYAVAYLIQRSILLATLFSVLACLAFMRGLASERAGKRRRYSAALVAYVLAVLSKEYRHHDSSTGTPAVRVRAPPTSAHHRRTGGHAALLLVSSVAAFFYSLYSEVLGRPFRCAVHRLRTATRRPIPWHSAAHLCTLSIFNEAGLFLACSLRWLLVLRWLDVGRYAPCLSCELCFCRHLAGGNGLRLDRPGRR